MSKVLNQRSRYRVKLVEPARAPWVSSDGGIGAIAQASAAFEVMAEDAGREPNPLEVTDKLVASSATSSCRHDNSCYLGQPSAASSSGMHVALCCRQAVMIAVMMRGVS